MRLQTHKTLSRITHTQRTEQGAPWPKGTWVETSTTSNAHTIAETEDDGTVVGVLDAGDYEIAGYARKVKAPR